MRHSIKNTISDPVTPYSPQVVTCNHQSSSTEMTAIAAKNRRSRFCSVTANTHIRAPVEVCFDLVARQIEEVPGWDPTIKNVKPVNFEDIGVGSQSQVTFQLGGSVEEATVVLCSFVPNRVIMWTSEHSTQIQEKWRFRSGINSTIIYLTISYNPYGGGLLKYLTRGMKMNRHLKQMASEILGDLRRTIEMKETR